MWCGQWDVIKEVYSAIEIDTRMNLPSTVSEAMMKNGDLSSEINEHKQTTSSDSIQCFKDS